MSHPSPAASRMVLAYDPGFRAGMTVPPEAADDPAAVLAAAAALPAEARALLDLLLLVVPAGEVLPDRLRDRIGREAGPLWRAALLFPRASTWAEGTVHPQHYAGSCRLNPLLQGSEFSIPRRRATGAPSFPPADARWDAVVMAALLEAQPGALTQDGVLRRDVERRLYTALGDDEPRWGLALRYARAASLARSSGGRLLGYPEGHPRPVPDTSALAPNPLVHAAAQLVMRHADDAWLETAWLVELLAGPGREALFSPSGGTYPQRVDSFDAEGFTRHEQPALGVALDLLHRVGLIDAQRDANGVSAFRKPQPVPRPTSAGFLLTPDGEILVHVAEMTLSAYGRLARMAPFIQGDALRRHRLSREGIMAELGAGHRDTLEYLQTHSRTGLPVNVGDQVREWQRSASRLSIVTGVDIVEEADGKLRVATPADLGRIIDYTNRPRARFVAVHGRMHVPDGWDPLDIRRALGRVARLVGREGDTWVYEPELRAHPDPTPLIAKLREYHGGELPAELETLLLAGGQLAPVVATDAVIVKLPIEAVGALRRDRVAGPLLRRLVSVDECVLPRADIEPLRQRLASLGVRWQEE